MRLCLLVLAICGSAAGQSLLPIEQGNYWLLDYVRPDERLPGHGRIAVHAPVALADFAVDTTLAWIDAPPAEAGSQQYHPVSFEGRTRFWPEVQPDTLFARADDDGNVWTAGYIADGSVRLLAEEQLWLSATSWHWSLQFNATDLSIGYARHRWIGQDEDDPDPGIQVWVESDPPYSSYTVGRGSLLPLARAVAPDLRPDGPEQLAYVHGSLNGDMWIEQSDTGVLFVSGFGPVYCGVQTDLTEFQGSHLRLGEALVGGRLVRPDYETVVIPTTWGNAKGLSR